MKNKINIKTIWNFFRSDTGKKLGFFLFYIFFFIFLFVLIGSSNINDNKEVNDSSFIFSLKNIENNDYNFTYTINHNDDNALYLGSKSNQNIVIKDDKGEYFYKYQNGKLISNQNILYDKLFDIYEIKKILKRATLIEETNLINKDKYLYTYEISNKDLNEIFNKDNSLDLKNEIIIETNSLKEVLKIKFNFFNYQKYFEEDLNKFNILITYGDSYEENNLD